MNKIQSVRLGDLKPDPKNPRAIDPKAREGLRQSLKEFGHAGVIVWNRRTKHVVGGHQRLALMREEGATDDTLVDVMVVDLEPARERALNIALNSPTITGRFTDDVREILRDLQRDIPEIASRLLIPQLDRDLTRILGRQPGDLPDDDAPPIPKKPASRTGDLYLLGKHRLLCGDSTNADDVSRLMNGEKAALLATDPPYLVDYKGGNHPERWTENKKKPTETKHWDDYVDPDASVDFFYDYLIAALPHCIAGVPTYQWHAHSRLHLVIEAWRRAGLVPHQEIIWVKHHGVITHSQFLWQHEPCIYGWPEGTRPEVRPPSNVGTVWRITRQTSANVTVTLGPGTQIEWPDGTTLLVTSPKKKPPRCQVVRLKEGQSVLLHGPQESTTVWEIPHDLDKVEHPTQKPVEIFARPIRYHTLPGDLCMEPFSGSGTQIVAAETLDRRCYAMEKAPAFADVAVARWEALTGRKADRKRTAP